MDNLNKARLINGDCKEHLGLLPDGFVDLIVTSPPYDNLRQYDGNSKWNWTAFKSIARDMCRVLVPGGVIVWVVGDQVVNRSESGTSFRQALFFMDQGLLLHDTMIYQKDGPSHPDPKRYDQEFEYMFVFSNGPPRTFNPIRDKKNKWAGYKIRGSDRRPDGSMAPKSGAKKGAVVKEYGKRSNVWRISTGNCKSSMDKMAFSHPAIFPEALARDHILSWSNPGGIVLDPFMGAGTVGKMAIMNDREFTGIEINEDYFKIAEERIRKWGG